MRSKSKRGISAAAWFYGQSFHGRQSFHDVRSDPAPAENPKPTQGPVEIWDGDKWVTVMAPAATEAK